MVNSSTFCIIPWIHLHTQPNGDVYHCCIAPYRQTCGSTTTHTLEEIWNNDYMKSIRSMMLSGEKPEGCSRCYALEDAGFGSSRKTFNKQFAHKIEPALQNTNSDGKSSNFELSYWDFRFSNICNFKCRMCGPALSSTWADETNNKNTNKLEKIIHIDNYSTRQIKEYVDRFINVVEEIYFAGGEPLLMDEHYYILEELIAKGRNNVYIRYNTNLSKLSYKNKSIIDYWKQFNKVDIYASLDATGSVGEYIRNGTNWRKIKENIQIIMDSKAANFGVNCTPQIFNILDLPNLIEELLSLNVDPNTILISNMLTHAEYYNVQTLPDIIKHNVELVLRDYQKNCKHTSLCKQLDSIIAFMNTPWRSMEDAINQNKMLKHRTLALDNIRNESYRCLHPIIVNWMDEL